MDSLVSRSPTKTENLSTGVLDKAMGTCWGRARRVQTLLPRALGAVKAISAYQDSIYCLHEVRLQRKAVSGTDNCPGTPMLRRDPKLLLQPMLSLAPFQTLPGTQLPGVIAAPGVTAGPGSCGPMLSRPRQD